MSDFYGCLESTSFRVKDGNKFLADPKVKLIIAYAKDNEGFFEEIDGYFSFGWSGAYPSPVVQFSDDGAGCTNDDDLGTCYQINAAVRCPHCESLNDGMYEIDLTELIQFHIVEDEQAGNICQIATSGNKKLIEVGGGLWWITSKGVVSFDACVSWDQAFNREDTLSMVKNFVSDMEKIL